MEEERGRGRIFLRKNPVFKMGGAAILDFQKFEIFTVGALQGANMRHRAKFRQDWSNGCRDMAI